MPAKELQAYAASAFLALAVGLCVAALAIPGVVRPGGWYVAFVALTCVLAVIALVAVSVPSLPEWVLAPQLLCVAGGASAIMVFGGGVGLVTLGYVGIVVVSSISPAGAVSILRTAVRADDLVVRLGGEELAVVAAVSADDLVELAERIRTQVELVAEPWSVTVSLGVTWEMPVPDGGGGGDADVADPAAALALVWTLLDHADDLMYAAKRAGRNRVVLAAS
jgi:hypothetical protein